MFSCFYKRSKRSNLNKQSKQSKKKEIKSKEEALADLDDTDYLKNYISSYESIPYFIPEIKYARVTDIRQDYKIIVAARLPFKNSLVYRFPIRLKDIDVSEGEMIGTIWVAREHNHYDYKAMNALFPLICGNIVELKNIKNEFGILSADVYCGEIHVNQWLVEKGLAVKSYEF